MTIEFDRSVGALYLRFRSGDIARTVEFQPDVYLDVDETGKVLGAEFIHADDFFALLERLEGRLDLPEAVPV